MINPAIMTDDEVFRKWRQIERQAEPLERKTHWRGVFSTFDAAFTKFVSLWSGFVHAAKSEAPMVHTVDDYCPPSPGLLDFRRADLFADNNGVEASFRSERTDMGLRVFVTLGGNVSEAADQDDQAALDRAVDLAIANFGG